MESKGTRVTYTHLALKSLGTAFYATKGDLGKIIFGKFIPIDGVDIMTLVDIDGKDLAGMTVRDCHTLSISGIIDQVTGKIRSIKNKSDTTHSQQTMVAKYFQHY